MAARAASSQSRWNCDAAASPSDVMGPFIMVYLEKWMRMKMRRRQLSAGGAGHEASSDGGAASWPRKEGSRVVAGTMTLASSVTK